jgi:hypothetical protein
LFFPSVLLSTESPILRQRFENIVFPRPSWHVRQCWNPHKCARAPSFMLLHPFCLTCISPSHEVGLCNPTCPSTTPRHPWSHLAWA